MKEYLGIYDEEYVQLFTARIKAKDEKEAIEKFKPYLELQGVDVYPYPMRVYDNKILIVDLENTDII